MNRQGGQVPFPVGPHHGGRRTEAVGKRDNNRPGGVLHDVPAGHHETQAPSTATSEPDPSDMPSRSTTETRATEGRGGAAENAGQAAETLWTAQLANRRAINPRAIDRAGISSFRRSEDKIHRPRLASSPAAATV